MKLPRKNLRFYGSALSLADVDPENSYGWMLSLKEGSLASFLISVFGVPHLGARIRHRILTKILNKPKKGESVLDIGCGFGLESLYLSQKGYKVVGFDLSRPKIKIAKRLNKRLGRGVKFISADLFKLKKIGDKFDRAILFEVLEHVKEPDKMLVKISTYLKKGGLIILSFPSKHPINAMSKDYLGHEVAGYEPVDISKMVEGKLKVKKVFGFGNSILIRPIFYFDYVFLRHLPLLSAGFFFLFYPLVVWDMEKLSGNNPMGYVIILEKVK